MNEAETQSTGTPAAYLIADDSFQSPTPVVYDADAIQIVPTILQDSEGEACEVLLQAAPLSDELIREYVAARATAAGEFATDAEMSAAAVRVAFDFFQRFIPTVAEVDGDLPPTWADEYGAQDRLNILATLLSCDPLQSIIASKIKRRKTWNATVNTASRVRLRSFFDGDHIETDLYFRKVSADLFGDYLRLKGESDELALLDKLAGDAATKPEDQSFYQKLFVRSENYAGRVPIHHRLVAVRAHLENSVRVTRKN